MKKEIAKNVSSGAEKVESIEEENEQKKPAKRTSQKSAKKNAASKKSTAKKPVKAEKEVSKKEEKREAKRAKAKKREEEAAQKRLKKAKKKAAQKEEKMLKRAKLKEKKLEKKAAYKAKKLEKKAALKEKKAERIRMKQEKKAAYKAKKLEKKHEKDARRELLKNESKAEKKNRIAREKKERIALARKKHEARDKARQRKIEARNRARQRKAEAREKAKARKAEDKKHKREQKTKRRQHAPGFGGWIAAVVSLGAACLALATVVTAGAVRMNEINTETANGYRSTLYEMVSVSEDMDDNLSKLRISSGSDEQRRLLTDLLVDSQLMESALERVPVDQATGTDISTFVNRTGSYARRLLSSLAAGKELTDTEKNTINYLAEVNANLYRELNDMVLHMSEKDFRAFLDGGQSEMQNKFSQAGKDTHMEAKTAVDAPFSEENNVGKNQLESMEEVSAERAQQLAGDYFNGYNVTNVEMTGEGSAHGAGLYNFVLTDANGGEIYAEISKNGGKLMFFDTYEVCTDKNFDLEECNRVAKKYLSSLGIDDVEATFLSDTGMVANITYVGVHDGVRVYPESIKVRVCEEKGRVVGIDASGYLFNHRARNIQKPALSETEALGAISKELTPYEINLTLVADNGKEALAYEIACYTDNEEFLVYIDALSGDEIRVYRIRESEGGKFIR